MVRDDQKKGWFNDQYFIPGDSVVGLPGSVAGLTIGSAGETQDDVVAFIYDASAPSGSRFTSLDLNAQNVGVSNSGNRLYVGAPRIFWAVQITLGLAASGDGKFLFKYWEGSALRQSTYMVIEGEQVNIGLAAFSGDASKSMNIIWDRDVLVDWSVGDDVLDLLPNVGEDLFWVVLEVGVPAPSTSARVDKIEIRGSGFDVVGIDPPRPIFWGRCRYETELTANTAALDAADTDAAKISNVNITSTIKAALHEFKNNKTESVSLRWKIPDKIDTSCKVQAFVDISGLAAGDVDWELDFAILKDGDPIGLAQSSTGTILATVSLPSAGVVHLNKELTVISRIDISQILDGTILEATLRRMGAADANAGRVFLHALRLVSCTWQLGKPV